MLPELFTIPFIDKAVYSYGVLLGLACVLGAHVAVHHSERSGIKTKSAWWMVLIVIVTGVVAGRVHDLWVQDELLNSLVTLREWLFNDGELSFAHSGRTAYGGYIGGTLAAIVSTRMFKAPFWRFADAVAPTLALGLGIVRIGCFCFGCDYGFRSDEWGVVFPPGSPAWTDQIAAGAIPDPNSLSAGAEAPQALAVFPVQFVASAFGFVLFGFLLKLWKRRPRRAGTVFLAFVVVYGIGRAGLEQLRSDQGRGELLGLSTSTTIGIATAVLCLALIFVPKLAALREDAGEITEPPKEDEGEDEKAAEGKKSKGKPGKKGKGKKGKKAKHSEPKAGHSEPKAGHSEPKAEESPSNTDSPEGSTP